MENLILQVQLQISNKMLKINYIEDMKDKLLVFNLNKGSRELFWWCWMQFH